MIGRCRHKKGDVSIFLSHLLLLDIPNNRADEVGGAHVLLVFGFVEFLGRVLSTRFLTPKKNKYIYNNLVGRASFCVSSSPRTTWTTEVIQGTRGTLIESYVGIKYFWLSRIHSTYIENCGASGQPPKTFRNLIRRYLRCCLWVS